MPNEARFRALVEQSWDLLCVLREDGELTYVNPAVERVLGQRADQVVGRNVLELIHPDDRAAIRRAMMNPDQPVEARFAARGGVAPDGAQENRWVVLETVASRPGPDAGVEGILVDARDITAKKAAEQALRDSEANYRRLFEESRDAICIGTLQGKLLDINPAGVKLFGYDSKAEMLSLDIARDLYWNPEDRKRTEEEFIAQGYVEDMELELKTKTGRRIRVIESASAFYDDQGQVVGFRGILRDVTEHRKLEEQLRQSQKMEAVGRLAGGVAHDFNNLLTAINGYSELALARMAPDDTQRQAIEEIRKAGKRATDLTRRLLTLSRHQVVAPRKLSLNRVVLDMEKLLERVIGEDITLRTELDPDLPPLYSDQGQIEQIILNLAVNSRDAMPSGGRLEISTRLVRLPGDTPMPNLPLLGDFIQLSVRDTGIGMERSVREHLFEPFFTTKGQGHNAGLGLAIVYGIVKQAGGHVDVDSVEGHGTTIHLFFPVEAPNKPALLDQSTSTGEPLPRGRETILLVEDESSVRSLVRQILEQQGYTVLAARNAKAAVALCDEHEGTINMLLTDVVMPGRSGLALAEDLQERVRELKVLFMSGYTDSHTGVKLLTQRQAAFLAKPFTPEALARKVREVLDA